MKVRVLGSRVKIWWVYVGKEPILFIVLTNELPFPA